jgi:hypothetical protein
MSQIRQSPARDRVRQISSTHVQDTAFIASLPTAQADIRDRHLASLIEQLEAARDLTGVAVLAGAALTELEAGAICAVLDDTVALLCGLRVAP